MQVSWSIFKGIVDSRWLSIQYVDIGDNYWMKAFDGPFEVECTIPSDPTHDETADFLANYFPNANVPYTDTDGRPIQKVAASRKGTTYLSDFATIDTGLSVTSLKWDVSAGNYTAKFYNASNVEVAANDANCVKTIINYAPPEQYEIIGGNVHVKAMATQACVLWVIGGATDLAGVVPSAVKEMVRYLDFECVQIGVNTDGRASKFMALSTDGVPVPTNKLQFIIRHAAGYQYKFSVSVELFR